MTHGDPSRRRRDELLVERNRLYDVEAFISAAGRVLIRVAGDPIDETVWDGIFRICEDIRLRTEAIQERIDRIDGLRGANA